MKYLIFIIALAVTFINPVYADPRIEAEQDLCHFPYNPDDTDNEVYSWSCDDADLIQRVDAAGNNIVSGSAKESREYELTDLTFPQKAYLLLTGSDADPVKYPDGDGFRTGYITATGSACAMVTSNYDAGAGANNQTEYTSNDWNIEIIINRYEYQTDLMRYDYSLNCRNGPVN